MTSTAEPAAYKHTLTLQGEREAVVTRVFDAPLEKVWRACTEPELIRQWWGRGNPLDVVRFEFEKGGHWRFVEHANGQSHGFEGRFREIVPMQRVSQTFEWDGMPGYAVVDTATYEDLGDGRTRVTTHSMFMTAAERDGMMQSGMEGGMAMSYAALDRLLATL
jgi:uncharacterized protein YndB with AHSA1/START domain